MNTLLLKIFYFHLKIIPIKLTTSKKMEIEYLLKGSLKIMTIDYKIRRFRHGLVTIDMLEELLDDIKSKTPDKNFIFLRPTLTIVFYA